MKRTWLVLAVGLAATPALAQPAQGEGMARMMALDTDHDGSISRDEARAGRVFMFARLDANHDNVLDANEHGGAQAQRMLAHADANGDGHITREEFMGQPYRAFDRLDANNDGVLSPSELAVMQAMGTGGG